MLDHRELDIVIFKIEETECLIIDVAMLREQHITKKQRENAGKYGELRQLWESNLKFVPIIIGALGSIPSNVKNHLKTLEISYNLDELQESALLGTARIQCKVLTVMYLLWLDRHYKSPIDIISLTNNTTILNTVRRLKR